MMQKLRRKLRAASKRPERWAKAGFLGAAPRLLGHAPRLEPPDWDARPYRVLYLRHDRVGDMILATGLIRAIAASHPTIRLNVLASPRNACVLRGNPDVESVVVFDKRLPWTYPMLVRRLRRIGFDAVIDCMVLSPSATTLLLMMATGAPYRIGVAGRGNDFFYTLPVEPTAVPHAHHIEHSAALAAAFGVDPDSTDWRPVLSLTRNERDDAERRWRAITPDNGSAPRDARRLLVNLSAGKARCRWPSSRFVEVLRHLRAHHPQLPIGIIGAPADARTVERVAADGGAAGFTPTTLRDAFALVATASLVFTPDTSITHAASAFRTPVAVLLPRKHADLYAPYQTAGRGIVSSTNAIEAVAVAPVVSVLEELLAEPVDKLALATMREPARPAR
jgi:ADP-heptose:LPS heptosyltransferase